MKLENYLSQNGGVTLRFIYLAAQGHYLQDVVHVKQAPLLHVMSKCCAEHRPSYTRIVARSINLAELLTKTFSFFSLLEQFVRLVNDQAFYTFQAEEIRSRFRDC